METHTLHGHTLHRHTTCMGTHPATPGVSLEPRVLQRRKHSSTCCSMRHAGMLTHARTRVCVCISRTGGCRNGMGEPCQCHSPHADLRSSSFLRSSDPWVVEKETSERARPEQVYLVYLAGECHPIACDASATQTNCKLFDIAYVPGKCFSPMRHVPV